MEGRRTSRPMDGGALRLSFETPLGIIMSDAGTTGCVLRWAGMTDRGMGVAEVNAVVGWRPVRALRSSLCHTSACRI